MLESSTGSVHHGRALLEYTDKYNIDIERLSSAKTNQENTKRESKKNQMKKGLEIERDSGKTADSLRDRVKSRKAGLVAARNATRGIPSICNPRPDLNETENNRWVFGFVIGCSQQELIGVG